MGAIGLNPIRLDRIGLDPIRINAIKLGVPGAASDRPYIDPEVLASLKAVCICYGKSNDDPDRAVVKNLVDPDNPFVISNAAYTEGSGYADKDSPYYGAFVTDGIDDLITSTKTASEMGITNEVTVISMIHQIGGLNSSAVNYGYTNYFRGGDQSTLRNNATGLNKTGIYGYSATNYTPTVINNILGDKNDYTTSSAGFSQSTYGNVFSVVGYKTSDTIAETSSVAWYWTVIANKVLTTDQINQVIAYFNLDRTLKPDILCNTIKQGITNENHAEFGDKLIDFSGNGRDIQLNNIAWDGDSGIGKYSYSGWKLTANKAGKYRNIRIYQTLNGTYTAKFEGVTELYNRVGIELEILSKNRYIQIKEDGIYSVDPVDDATELQVRFGDYTDTELYDCDITITQIPSHAGALCLDGVNDFGKATGMPIYKDYTFIIDYERISYTSEGWGGAIVSKSPSANNGAFISMMANSAGTNKQLFSFGGVTAFIKDDLSRILFWQTKYKSENTELTVGEGVDGDTLWLGTLRDNDSRFFNGAIYSLMPFPYSMSEFLIERQLKKHKLGTLYPDMVEFRPIVKSNLPYSSISYSVNPGEYISVDSMVTITVTLPNTSDELMAVSCNAISDISISGDNGVYEITGKVVKSPQKINLVISSYLTMLNNETLISNETLIKNE